MRITTALDSTSLTTRYPKTALATTLLFMLALHVVPQEIPVGDELTLPLPTPDLATVTT